MLTPTRLLNTLTTRRGVALLGAAAVAGPALALPSAASADHKQVTIIQDQSQIEANPMATLQKMRALGATTVRVVLYWTSVAPNIQATKKPKFDASSPGGYAAGKWAIYDSIVRDAASEGMTVDLTVAGGAPRWAEGSGIPRNWIIAHNPNAVYDAWKPNGTDFGQFVHAVATRYSGHYAPKGAPKLPRVHFWTIWNEPNFGQDLAPQATDTSRISYAPMMYRNLVRSGYRALSQTGHKHDTILIGEVAAHGSALSHGKHGRTWPQGLPGWGAQTQPLPFIRTLYCLSQSGHKLSGKAARQVGCPTTAKGRRAFRKDNPGLFAATGVGDHPYANHGTPKSDGKGNPEWSTFPNLPRLERTLDGATHAYGSGKHFPIYNDEYGYITRPPSTSKTSSVPVSRAARYLNWAEYLSWQQGRVASYDQYLLNDPKSNGGSPFSTGLYTFAGKAKATLNAFRMPLWIPSATLHHAGRARVWGEARPARWTGPDSKHKQSVAVQFQAHGKGPWKTVATARSNGYFVVRPRFTKTGKVRLRYTYPKATDSLLPPSVAGSTIVSRSQRIVVK